MNKIILVGMLGHMKYHKHDLQGEIINFTQMNVSRAYFKNMTKLHSFRSSKRKFKQVRRLKCRLIKDYKSSLNSG